MFTFSLHHVINITIYWEKQPISFTVHLLAKIYIQGLNETLYIKASLKLHTSLVS